jgi:hypothetical protein
MRCRSGKARWGTTRRLGSTAAWPMVAQAQQDERVRRMGVLMAFDENDPKAKGYLAAFADELSKLGWTDGRNMRADVRWATGKVGRLQALSKELIELQPDVIFTSKGPETAALQRETQTIPIVFVLVGEPVEQGFVQSLARPGGNISGFIPQGHWAPGRSSRRCRWSASSAANRSTRGGASPSLLFTEAWLTRATSKAGT